MSDKARHAYPSGTLDQFNVRFPSGMRDRIRMAAEENGRSMNAEIIATLEAAYPEPMDESGARALLDYMLGATTQEEFSARKQEVNARLKAMGSGARVYPKSALNDKVGIIKPMRPRD